MSVNEVRDNTIERVTFVWKINDFSGRIVHISSYFPSSGVQNVRNWCLLLNSGNNDGTKVSIFLNSKNFLTIVGTVKMSLINDTGNVAISKISNCNLTEHLTCFVSFVTRDYILNKDNGVLPNDELTIVCDIEMRHRPENRYREFVPEKFEAPLCRLAEDMGQLLSAKSLTDLTITVGEREFRAPKAILAARSPVFAAMFRNEMVEKEFSAVDITDIDPDVFQVMLEYIYTGKVISQTNKSQELLAAANKYELERLKFMCEEALSREVSVENVPENIALADHYNASYLKEYLLCFAINNSSDVIGSSGWVNFKRTNQSLAIEMLEKFFILK